MAADATNVIELVLEMKDTDIAERKMDDVTESAMNMVKSVQSGVRGALKSVTDSISSVTTAVEKFQKTTLTNMLQRSVGELRNWFKDATNALADGSPGMLSAIEKWVVQPVREMYKVYSEAIDKIVTGVRGWYTKLVKQDMPKLMYTFTLFTKNAIGVVSDFTMKKVDYLRKTFPRLAKVIEGSWLVGKVAALGFTSAVLKMPSVVKTAGQALGTLSGKVREYFQTAKTKVLAVGKVFSDIKGYFLGSAEAARYSTGEVTKLRWAFEKIKSVTTFTLKVLGVTAALGIVGGFVASARNTLGGIGKVFDTISDAFALALQPIINEFTKLAYMIAPYLIKLMVPLFKHMLEGAQTLNAAFSKFVQQGTGFGSTLNEFLGNLVEMARGFMEVIMTVVRELVPAILPLLKVFQEVTREIIITLAPILKNIIDNLIPGLMSAVRGLMPVVGQMLKILGVVVAEVVKELIVALLPIIEKLIAELPPLIPAMGELIRVLGEFIIASLPIIKIVLQVISALTTKLLVPALVWTLTKVFEGLTAIIKLINGAMSFTIDKLGDKVTSGFNMFVDLIVWNFKVIMGIKDWLLEGFGEIVSSIVYMWERVKSVLGLDSAVDNVKGIFKTIIGTVTSVTGAITDFINDNIIESIRTLLTTEIPVIGKLTEVVGIPPPTYLQFGGVVTKPLLAGIGEAGPEVVLPLKKDVLAETIPEFLKVEPPLLEMPKVKPVQVTAEVKVTDRLRTTREEQIEGHLAAIREILMGASERAERESAAGRDRIPLRVGMDHSFSLTGLAR